MVKAVYFTVVVDEAEKNDTKNQVEQMEQDTDDTLEGRILLVEDNAVNQLITGKMLEKLGIQYEIAGNGQEAIQCWENNSYDIILMDMHMPIMDGVSATEEIRSREKVRNTTWIIALTANVLQEDIRKCFNVGMNDYLSKPLEIETLKLMLLKWLSSKRQDGSEQKNSLQA